MQLCTSCRAAAAGRHGAFTSLRITPARHLQPQRARAVRASPSQPGSSSSRTSSSSSRGLILSPAVKTLQGLELLALGAAAACQAAALLQAALAFSQAQCDAAQAAQQQQRQLAGASTAAGASSEQPLQRQQQQLLVGPGPTTFGSSGSSPLLSLSLLVALMCGAALRYLQAPRPLQLPGGVGPSADAAARLVALEVAAQQQAGAITATSRQLDKLQARVRVATSDLKTPIRQVQGSTGQAAAAIVKLSEQQQRLQQQVEGSQELIGALHALAAKQFKVSADALQQLKQGQSQLGSSTAQQLGQLAAAQQQLQEQLQAQRRQLRSLEQQLALQQRRQQRQQQAGDDALQHMDDVFSDATVAGGSGGNGSMNGALPDPWMENGSVAAAAANGGGGGHAAFAGAGRAT